MLLDQGVDCFKTDFGERIPTDVVYYDGSDPELMHNYYTYLYNKCVFELLEEYKGKDQACLFARSLPVCPQRHRGRPEVPRALGRRLLLQLPVHERVPAGRPVPVPVRLRLLEPRHLRL